MSPGKRKAARRLLDSWINDIYVRAGSCLQRSRPPCSAGEKRAGPRGRIECATERRWLRGSRDPAGNNRRARAAGRERRPRGNSAPRLRAEPAVGPPGACTGSPASSAPGTRLKTASLRLAECPGSAANCSGLPTEPGTVRCPVYSLLNECGSGGRASPPARHPLVHPPDLLLGAGVRNGCVPASRGSGGGGRPRRGPMPALRRSCWSGLREGGGGPGAAERGTPVGRSPGAPAAGQLRGRAGRGLDSPPAAPGPCRGADGGCCSPPSPLGFGGSGQESLGQSSRGSAPLPRPARRVTGAELGSARAAAQEHAASGRRCPVEPRGEPPAAAPG